MTQASSGIIDQLVGIAPGSALDAIRARRPEARANAERSYRELFAPQAAEGLALRERLAVAAFVARLHRSEPAAAHYAGLLCGGDARFGSCCRRRRGRRLRRGPRSV